MDIKDYAQMMSYLTRPRDVVPEPRNMANGGRIGYKNAKLVVKPPSWTKAQEDYLGQLKDKRKVKTQSLYDALEVKNTIIKNKGYVSSIEELGKLADIIGLGGKVDHRKTQLALDLALDSFDELKGFQLASDKYPNIDGKKFRKLDMIAKSFANYKNTKNPLEAAAHLLPDNMAMIYDYDVTKKKTLGKGLFDVGKRNVSEKDKKFLIDRISTLTGQNFNLNQLNELLSETQKVRRATGSIARQLKRSVKMNEDIKNLANDEVIQNLLKGDLDRKTQTKLLEKATELVGGDASIASRRLFQMAEAMSDTTNKYKDLGIKLNNTTANKIIATGKQIGGVNNRYGMSSVLYDYYGNVVDKALGATEGKTFIGKYQQQIRNLLDKGQSPDEIFSLTASARRGMSPYAIFTQNLRTDVNSAIKGAYIDSALSKKHEQLQEIFKGRTYNQLNAKDKTAANKLVKDFEKIKINALNQPINPGEVKKGAKPIYLTADEKKNIQLPEFDLKNPPSKAIAGYKGFNKNLQSAFDTSYKNVGYSMKVPKQYLTQKQMIADLTQGVSKFGSKGNIAAGIVAGVLGYKGEDILKGTGLMDKEYELTASAGDAPIVEKGLSTGEKAAIAGGAGVGAYKFGKPLAKKALKFAAGAFGPTGIALSYPAFGMLGEDYKTDLNRPLDRAILSAELAGSKALVKGTQAATSGIKNQAIRSGLQKFLNLGMSVPTALKVARYASPLGIASLGLEGLYQVGKLGYEDQQRFNALSPEEQAAERAEQEKFAFDITGA